MDIVLRDGGATAERQIVAQGCPTCMGEPIASLPFVEPGTRAIPKQLLASMDETIAEAARTKGEFDPLAEMAARLYVRTRRASGEG